ncbi:MAG: PrsW family glutamic-type intramembrane protease [Chloroflexota bacterium]
MTIFTSALFPLFVLFVMYAFGMYTTRNLRWVALCIFFGAFGFGVSYFVNPQLRQLGLGALEIGSVFNPLVQQVVVLLGTYFVVSREKFDNLIDGAVYGFASGLGYSLADNIFYAMNFPSETVETVLLRSFSSTLVYATASGIVGVTTSRYYFQGRENRVTFLLGGLGAGVGYAAFFNLLVNNRIGGDIMPAAYGIGGFTLIGLYVTGQLRRILIQVGVEKRRADSLLDIVIPIGVQLSVEKDFGRLLENILVEAKRFCKADAGTLYLLKGNQLVFAVVRNDTLRIAAGGTTNEEITLPALNLYDENGEPNHRNVATHAALSGQIANIPDAYDSKDFDFSGTKVFDRLNGYQSISFLTIPLKNANEEVLGVLQLINALNPKREIVPFDKNLQQLMGSFSSLATAALEGYIQEQKLRAEIQQLRIEIDAVKRTKQVEEITNTDYFRTLREKAKTIRESSKPDESAEQKE